MSMTICVTRDVEDRYRGFLRSCMIEVAAGVYLSVDLNAKTRDSIWKTVSKWHSVLGRGSIVMLYADKGSTSGFAMRVVGEPSREIYDLDGLYVIRLRD